VVADQRARPRVEPQPKVAAEGRGQASCGLKSRLGPSGLDRVQGALGDATEARHGGEAEARILTGCAQVRPEPSPQLTGTSRSGALDVRPRDRVRSWSHTRTVVGRSYAVLSPGPMSRRGRTPIAADPSRAVPPVDRRARRSGLRVRRDRTDSPPSLTAWGGSVRSPPDVRAGRTMAPVGPRPAGSLAPHRVSVRCRRTRLGGARTGHVGTRPGPANAAAWRTDGPRLGVPAVGRSSES